MARIVTCVEDRDHSHRCTACRLSESGTTEETKVRKLSLEKQGREGFRNPSHGKLSSYWPPSLPGCTGCPSASQSPGRGIRRRWNGWWRKSGKECEKGQEGNKRRPGQRGCRVQAALRQRVGLPMDDEIPDGRIIENLLTVKYLSNFQSEKEGMPEVPAVALPPAWILVLSLSIDGQQFDQDVKWESKKTRKCWRKI